MILGRNTDLPAFVALVNDEIAALRRVAVEADRIHGEQQLDRAEFACVCLVIRSISHARASVMLMAEGHEIEAGILLRNCIENLMLLAALEKDPEGVVADLVEKWKTDSKSLGESAMRHPALQGDEAFRTNIRKALKDIRGEITGRKHGLNPQSLSPRGDLDDLYLAYQDLSIDVAHPTMHALNRHVTEPELGFRLDKADKPGDAGRFYSFLSMTLVGLLDHASTILRFGFDPPGLQGFHDRHIAAQGND